MNAWDPLVILANACAVRYLEACSAVVLSYAVLTTGGLLAFALFLRAVRGAR